MITISKIIKVRAWFKMGAIFLQSPTSIQQLKSYHHIVHNRINALPIPFPYIVSMFSIWRSSQATTGILWV